MTPVTTSSRCPAATRRSASATHLVQRPRAGRAAHLRDDAEGAAERAAVLHPQEGAHPCGGGVAGPAAAAAEAAQQVDHRGRGALGRAAHDVHARPEVGQRLTRQVRRAARHHDDAVGAAGERLAHALPRLADRLPRHAAAVDDVDVAAALATSSRPSAASRSRSTSRSVRDTLQPRNSPE